MLLHSLRPPLELVLSWQTSQFPHGIRRGWGLVVLIGFFLTICLVFVILRTHIRIRRRTFGIDDALIIFAMLFATGVDASIILGFVRYGYDRHAWDLTQPMALRARKMVLVIEQLNSTSTCLTKISILFFYRRLAGGPTYTSKFVRLVQANILFVAAYLLVFSVVLFLTCYPFPAYWLQFDIVWSSQNTYKCLDEAANTVAANAISILQDFIACGLPSVLLWKLQMPKKKKVLLGCLLGLGILPCIAGVLRLYYTVLLYSTYDSTWAAHPVFAWTVVETHLGILCASAPALHSYARDLARSRAWSGTLSLFRYLSSSLSLGSRAGGGGGGGGGGRRSRSRSASSGYLFGGRKKRGKRSGSASGGHIELSDAANGNSGAARRRSAGGKMGADNDDDDATTLLSTTLASTATTTTTTTTNAGSVRSLSAGATGTTPTTPAASIRDAVAKGLEDDAGLAYPPQPGFGGTVYTGVATPPRGYRRQQQAVDALDVERHARRRGAGVWYLETLPEMSPIRLGPGEGEGEVSPMSYQLGQYRQESPPSTGHGDEEEEEEVVVDEDDGGSQAEIGLAVTAERITGAPVGDGGRRDVGHV